MVVGNPSEIGAEAEFGGGLAIDRIGGGFVDARSQAVADVFEQRRVQIALRVEVLVQHGLRDAGGIGDVVHGTTVEAGLREDLEGDRENLFAAGGCGESLRHCYPMVTG